MHNRAAAVVLALVGLVAALVFVDVLVTKLTVLWGVPLFALAIYGSISGACFLGAKRLWESTSTLHSARR